MSDAPLLVSLFTDAGYCPDTHCGSYAVWAKLNEKTLRRSGVLKGAVASNNVAEVRALVNGMAMIVSGFSPPAGSRVIAQTDSLTAIAWLGPKGPSKASIRRHLQVELETIRGIIQRAGLVVEYRHIHGHKGKNKPRNAVNTWCDRECRRFLREAREAVRCAAIAEMAEAEATA